jgi:transcriptional regulator with XRE-family HTH domain
MQVKGEGAVKDILTVITNYRVERGWSEYQLAERSGLPQSTISSWYRKGMVPSIPSLEKICTAFGITLSQLFAEGEAPVALTTPQRKLLEKWSRLTEEQQAVVFALIEKM